MVGRGGPRRNEEGAPAPQCVEISGPGPGVGPGELSEFDDVREESGPIRIDDVIGAKGGDDASAPAGLSEPRVRLQDVEGTLGRGEELDAEPFEDARGPKSPWANRAEISS